MACRTIRDRTGKVAREVFYYSASAGLVPQTGSDLRVQSVSVYYHDTKGRVDHIENWEVGRRVPRVERNAYDTSGELSRKWFVEPDGVRRYEMRFSGLRKLADLYFDDTGNSYRPFGTPCQ